MKLCGYAWEWNFLTDRPAGVAEVCNLDANVTRFLHWICSSLCNFLILCAV